MRKPLTKWGRPLRRRTSRTRSRARRDNGGRPTSDTVWGLVERMIEGDADAAIVLDDAIEQGVSAGKTTFMKLPSGGQYERDSKNYAAVTPGRQITLFGVKRRYPLDKRKEFPNGVLRGYISRYKIGDAAEYSSYNLVYFGTITSITSKRVMIDKGRREGKASLTIERFSAKNWDPNNLEEGLKRNREWSD